MDINEDLTYKEKSVAKVDFQNSSAEIENLSGGQGVVEEQ